MDPQEFVKKKCKYFVMKHICEAAGVSYQHYRSWKVGYKYMSAEKLEKLMNAMIDAVNADYHEIQERKDECDFCSGKTKIISRYGKIWIDPTDLIGNIKWHGFACPVNLLKCEHYREDIASTYWFDYCPQCGRKLNREKIKDS